MFESWWEEPKRRHRIKRLPPPSPADAKNSRRSRQTMFNTVRRRVAHHTLEGIIKQGCVIDKDIDVPVKCSDVYGGFWYNFLRSAVIWRDQGRCRMCGAPGSKDVHHVKPRWLGGIDHPYNLITLCTECHKAEHKRRMVEKAKNDGDQTTLDSWEK